MSIFDFSMTAIANNIMHGVFCSIQKKNTINNDPTRLEHMIFLNSRIAPLSRTVRICASYVEL